MASAPQRAAGPMLAAKVAAGSRLACASHLLHCRLAVLCAEVAVYRAGSATPARRRSAVYRAVSATLPGPRSTSVCLASPGAASPGRQPLPLGLLLGLLGLRLGLLLGLLPCCCCCCWPRTAWTSARAPPRTSVALACGPNPVAPALSPARGGPAAKTTGRGSPASPGSPSPAPW